MKPVVIIPIHIVNENVYKLTVFALKYLCRAIEKTGKDIPILLSGHVNYDYVTDYSNWIQHYSKEHPTCKLETLFRYEPHGFAENVNYGLAHLYYNKIDFDYVLLLNNDLLVPEFIFDSFERGFEQAQLVSILSNYAMGIQKISHNDNIKLDEKIICDVESYNELCNNWKKENFSEYERTPILSFLCTAIKKEVIDDVGVLDEIFKIGTFEDVDYTSRAYKKGYKSCVARECFCFHFGSSSFKSDNKKVNEITAYNKLLFLEKCGIDNEVKLNEYLGFKNLDSVYDLYKDGFNGKTSELSDHLHTLKILANNVNRVTEFGTGEGISTIALLAGRPISLKTYDIEEIEIIDKLKNLADGTQVEFIHRDTSTTEIDETDLLLIDTVHNDKQLSAELTNNAHRVKRFIVITKTHKYAKVGENCIYNGGGILDTIRNFLKENIEWNIKRNYNHNGSITSQYMSNNKVA